MTAAFPLEADTIYRWRVGREEVAAQAIGAIAACDRSRVVLLDTAERHWLAEVSGGHMEIVAGPVTGDEALRAAMMVVAGIADHGSVTAQVTTLAIGLVARACGDAAGTLAPDAAERGTA